jgi:hypothetical protein
VSALAEGTYTATVTVSGGNDIAAEFPVSFKVYPASIEIGSAEELAKIGVEYPASGEYLLIRNIEINDWTPITADKTSPFTGTFHGGGYTIVINSFSSKALNTGPVVGYIGIFGYIKDGRVENLGAALNMPQEQKISAGDTSYSKDQYIGAVSGYAENTAFEDIQVSGSINLNKPDGSDIYLGGVTGYLKGGGITASDAVKLSLIAQEPYTAGNGYTYTGGLAAYTESAEISLSRVDGFLSAFSNRGYAYAGGATGRLINSTLSNITVGAEIEAIVSKTFTGIATFGNACNAGGLTGMMGGDSAIRECSSKGTVTAITYAPTAGGNTVYAGGILGNHSAGIVSDCYSQSNVSAKTGDGFSGQEAKFYTGGLVGRLSNGTVERSYAAGVITADSDVPQGNYTHAGGIVGVMYGSSMATIIVQNCAALSPRINWRLYTQDADILKRVAIRGNITGGTAVLDGTVGQPQFPDSSTLSNNIANEDMVINYDPSPQQAAKVPEIILDPGPDTEDGADCDAMPAQIVYEKNLGWNFATVWKMGSDGYPALQWQK